MEDNLHHCVLTVKIILLKYTDFIHLTDIITDISNNHYL